MEELNPVKKNDILEIYTDGAANGNPGKGAASFVFIFKENIIFQDCCYLGDITNNQAEYQALICALDKAIEFTRWHVKVFSDSELVVKQMKGDWRIKDPTAKALFRQAQGLSQAFKKVEYYNVARSNKYIKIADQLCSGCIKENMGQDQNELRA